ncbi:MAG: class I SAM-dependent methyltransferase [Chitinophagaceae bacterium]|nr:class I SAM-dependent methyltransferase [Chitinophagaceae bacterium]
MIKQFIKKLLGRDQFNSLNYWENRYAGGGNSGDGSYGRLSVFKADFINKFIEEKKIHSAVEMGCGDGHQLSIIHYPSYTGMDVSSTIIDLCRKKFEGDTSKKFVLYKPDSFVADDTLKADVALSLDVLYHIVEENNYLKYLQDLFSLGKKYVVVYSTNFYLHETQHVLHRKFTDDAKRFTEWTFIAEVKNPFPGNGEQESMADFFVFEKQG